MRAPQRQVGRRQDAVRRARAGRGRGGARAAARVRLTALQGNARAAVVCAVARRPARRQRLRLRVVRVLERELPLLEDAVREGALAQAARGWRRDRVRALRGLAGAVAQAGLPGVEQAVEDGALRAVPGGRDSGRVPRLGDPELRGGEAAYAAGVAVRLVARARGVREHVRPARDVAATAPAAGVCRGWVGCRLVAVLDARVRASRGECAAAEAGLGAWSRVLRAVRVRPPR